MAKSKRQQDGGTATLEAPATADVAPSDFREFPEDSPAASAPTQPAPPKVRQPHEWVGRMVYYWRVTNQSSGEISALPAMLIEPIRGTDGWALNFWVPNIMQGRRGVKFSETPRAGYWTWPGNAAPDQPQQ